MAKSSLRIEKSKYLGKFIFRRIDITEVRLGGEQSVYKIMESGAI